MKEKNNTIKNLLLEITTCIVLIAMIVCNYEGNQVEEIKDSNTITANMSSGKEKEEEFVYLSNLDYIESESKSGWGELLRDKTSNNTQISVKVNGVVNTFAKGMWAHASSVLMYDLKGLDYDYFTSLIGLNTTSRAGNGVTFRIYTSEDGSNFELQKESVKLPQEDAEFIKIDIRGKRYLKLEAYDNRGNGQDHSVYADAKLTKESYETSLAAINIEKYNEKIKNYGEVDLNNAEQELTVLQRDLIKNAGEFTIKRFIGESRENKEAFEWLFNNVENLRLYTMGGKPSGSYYNSFQVLRRLLEAHQSDFDNNEITKYGTRYGDLYKRMAITLSLTHSAQVALWMQPGAAENQSDAVTRYEIYKELHKNDKFKAREDINITKWFESYNIEEMRFVMNNLIDDESIVWLNEYVQSKIDANPNSAWGLLTPHPYMAYVWPNYGNPVYYDEANYDYFNELFSVNGKKLYDYGITRGTSEKKVYKVWMNFRNKFGTGAVCGGISKTGSNIRATHGIPVAVIGQPGHAAIIYYTQDAQGKGYWNLDNDVSGWAYSEKGERMLLGWGNEVYQRGYSVVYMALAQEVLNDYETFEASQKKVLLADVYEEDLVKRERIYREALEIQPYNINAWYGLILTYNANSNKTEDEYYELAKEIGENLKYFPLPMLHLTNLIKPRLTSIENNYKFTLLQTRILTEGTKVPNNSADNYSVYQPALTRLEANHLLGKLDKTIATFSFDGEDAGKIVLSSRYDSNGVRWDYSLDGGNTWKEVAFTAEEEHKLQLSAEEIANITEENDIKVHIVGVNYEPENIFVIDITKAQTPTTLFGNDLENRVIGINLTYEWRRNENEAWTSYSTSSPDNTGNKKLQVRVGATGTSLPSDVLEFEFTEDNQPDTRKYVSISHLSIHEYSTAATGQGRYATNAIDGNYNTNWHSAWNGTDTERFITIKLDKPRYISAVEYVPAGGGNGKILDGTVFGSTDGENWEVLYIAKNLTYTNQANTNEDAIKNTKSFEIENPKEVEYIKIVADRASNGNWFTAREFNFFQDLTKNPRPTAGVGYSITSPTNQNVVARLINPSTNITITNNGGSDTYTFTENGEFTFEFVDENGIVGTSTASVNWIDKEVPTATFEYSITEKTNEDVIVRLLPSEEVTVLNNGESSVENPTVDPFTYTFLENGEFTFEFKDKAGNIGRATAKVDWIDNVIPEATINYSTLDVTNQDVTVKIEFDKENVRITNNNGSDTYTFKENGEFTFNFVDEAGNANSVTAKVSWIDRVVPTATITYDKMNLTNQSVTATIGFNKNNVTILNNNGSNTYTFTENGKFTFEYQDQAGNKGTSTAEVNWIDKIAPEVIIEYSTTSKTNQSVTATLKSDKEIIILNNASNVYTFTENGEFTFEYVDKAGNTGTITAKVSWIDRIVPNGIITYDRTELTNQNVTATITFDKENVIVTNNNNLNTYVFEKNGEFTFEYVDEAGNKGTSTAKVNWIDKVLPNGIITYDRTELTNQNVTATIIFDKEDVNITNNNGLNTYIFEENGEFTFEFEDKLGNKNTATAKVNWIDKEAPVARIIYSTISTTRNPVIATIECDEKIYITNNEGKNTYTFEENGEFTFEYRDEIGNTGSVTASVNWINKEIANSQLTYSKTELTNEDVTVFVSFDKENVTILNNNGSNTYTFTENGEFTFEYRDEAGNTGKAIAVVNWIDKTAPTATFEFNTSSATNKDVVVTLVPSEKVEITNNEGKNTYTFEENGEFTFEFKDMAGNLGNATVRVNWIDRVKPNGTITYDKTDLTNQNVTATITFDKENVTVTNNNNSNTYTFEKNGEFTFEYVDEAGNTNTTTAKVDWIDKVLPNGIITYDKTDLTNQNVTVSITFDKENVTILNNNGSNTYTFTENGNFEFIFEDALGNRNTAIATVSWINKVLPRGMITYDRTELTNQSVTATITFDKENITILNNNGLNTYTFTENGKFEFEFKDAYGNKNTATANVSWIDKTLPEVTISYNITTPTNKSVTATIDSKEEIKVTNNNGSNTYTFEENGEFTFEYVDKAGNIGRATAKVDWINKEIPEAKISFNKDSLTNQDVIATITFDKENVKITNNNGLNTYTFTENGSFIFEFIDEAGNIGTEKVTVCWIDKKIPNATITYSNENLTNQNVTATISFDKEEITILNNNGSNTYTFEKNGEFEFEYVDKAGNKGKASAIVNWIDKEAPVVTVEYDKTTTTKDSVTAKIISNEPIIITNNDGKETYTFEKNGEFTFEYKDYAGNTGTITAVVDWIDRIVPSATIIYSIPELTNQNVTATIIFDKTNIKVTNNNGLNTYTFTENGEFTFEFIDEVGNVGKLTAKVDWIDKTAPEAKISFDKDSLTNQNVTATITFDKENVTITNNNGSNTYIFTKNGEFTFEFVDKAGNIGSKKVSVNWIDKEAPKANLIYDITEPTTSYVTVFITFNKPNVKIINNDGKNDYTFIKNGEFTFEFIDEAGNVGVILASVNWIENEDIIIPSDPMLPNNSNNNNTSKPNDNYNNNSNVENGYKKYTAQNITLTIPAKVVKEELTLKKTKLILPLTLKEKLGSASEYFELTLKNDENETVNVLTHYVLTIKLDETKEFLGIYSITEDEIIERLNHKQLEDNSIEVETEKISKFIISYNEKTEEKSDEEKKEETKEEKHNNFVWYVLSCIVAIMGVLIGYIKVKRTNNQY